MQEHGTYSYEKEEQANLKKYYKNGRYDPGDEFGTAWGEKDLLVVDETQGGTIDRFYVMALKDFTTEDNTVFYWDKNVREIYYETDFGFKAGKDNTELLIEYWENSAEDEEIEWDDQDIWKNIDKSLNWFVPSKYEWNVFVQALINPDEYEDYGLCWSYWTSSQVDETVASYVGFTDLEENNGSVNWEEDVNHRFYVRLSATY